MTDDGVASVGSSASGVLTRDKPIARLAGAVAIVKGVATSWVFGFLLLQGEVSF